MKSYKEFLTQINENQSDDIKVGDVLICIHGKDESPYDGGRIHIASGDEAYSAEVYKGDKFTVTDTERNPYYVYGKLNLRSGRFVRDAGVSGKDPEKLKQIPIVHDKIEYAIQKIYINDVRENDFWACWETYNPSNGEIEKPHLGYSI